MVVGYNFIRKLNFATGFSEAGMGIGAFGFTLLGQLAKDHYGYTGFFLISAGISLQVCISGVIFLPSKLEKRKSTEGTNSTENKKSNTLHYCKRSFSILCHKGFLLLVIAGAMRTLGQSIVYVHFSNYAIQMGTTEFQAATLLSIAGLVSVAGRVLIGLAGTTDNIEELVMFAWSIGVFGLVSVLYPLYVMSYVGQLVFAFFIGCYTDSDIVFWNSIICKLLGVENLAYAVGLEMFGSGIGAISGPPFAGESSFISTYTHFIHCTCHFFPTG